MELLGRIITSMGARPRAAGVAVVAGDTKVVEQGSGDGLFITTTGVGLVPEGVEVGPERARPGDVVLVSGPVGDHGIAILSVREGLEFGGEIASDSAPLHGLVAAMLAAAPGAVRALRDPTRGRPCERAERARGRLGRGDRAAGARDTGPRDRGLRLGAARPGPPLRARARGA